jgi:hypothetical protein
MEEKPNYEKDLASIRDIMERSSKFISLSGLSGIMAGLYAIIAAVYAFYNIYFEQLVRSNEYFDSKPLLVWRLVSVAFITLVASLVTGIYFSHKKAQRVGSTIWNATSRRMLVNLGIPLITGGLFALICLWHGYFGIVAPICLLFYGLALVNASQNMFDEIRYLGYCEIVLGILSAIFIGYGLFFWAFGFGVLHIIYGALMYRKYDA